MQWEYVRPQEIENRSMSIIRQELGTIDLPEAELSVLLRVIHTTADFSYRENLYFSETAIERGLAALSKGAKLVTDTNMALAGINKRALSALGGTAHCFMAEEDVAAEASSRGITRAAVSMEKACTLGENTIFVIGNAPTALIRLDELIRSGAIAPQLIIAVPVGFVNVVEAKELIVQGDTPCIVARGRKGGSNVAAAICNALLYRLTR
jgi:precorrin-8X/cobalt-precorrin-8 methylmutase